MAKSDAADLASTMKGLATGSMQFAFGHDNDTCRLVVHRTKGARALSKELKSDTAYKKLTCGTVLADGPLLVLELDGPNLTGMIKRLKALLRQERVSKYTDIQILVGGVEAPHDADERPEVDVAAKPEGPASHAVTPEENAALIALGSESLLKTNLTQKDPKKLLTEEYMDTLVGLKVKGAKDPKLKDIMKKLGKGVTPGERKSLIAELAKIRGCDAKTLDAEYDRFLLLRAQQDACAKSKKQEGVPDVNERVHGDFVASNPQLVFGKVIGDTFGIDAVFGAMLSPTGGMVGPGNAALHMDDDEPTGYHGIVHDAAGYLFNYHDQGPGYDYLGREERATSDPMTGQQSGMRYWHEKLDPGAKTVVLTGVIDVVYGVKDTVAAVKKAASAAGKSAKAKADEVAVRTEKALSGARKEVGQAFDSAVDSASKKAGKARTALEKAADEVAASARAAKAAVEQAATQKLESAKQSLGAVAEEAAAKLDAARNFLWS